MEQHLKEKKEKKEGKKEKRKTERKKRRKKERKKNTKKSMDSCELNQGLQWNEISLENGRDMYHVKMDEIHVNWLCDNWISDLLIDLWKLT